MIKSNRLQHFKQTDQFAVLEKINNYFIVRGFEVATWYNRGSYYSHTCEYCRQVYDIDEHLIMISDAYNDNITATINGKYVNHTSLFDNNWRENGSYYHTLGEVYKLFPYNLRKTLIGTKWQYSQLDIFAKNIEYFCIVDFLGMSPKNLEMLIKNKLFSLAYSIVRQCGQNYFIKINYHFIKQNLDFIRKHKLNVDELITFEFVKTKNIRLIKKYADSINLFKRFEEYNINLEIADKKIKSLHSNLHEYIDYLRFAKELGYNLKDKNIMYPKNIVKKHDQFYKMIELRKNKRIASDIRKRYKELSKNIFQDKRYIIFPAKNFESMIDESSQMNNCVKTYAKKFAEGDCDIYFMRLVNNQKKSLVTVEVQNNKVVQKRTKNNEITTKSQDDFLSKWEREVLKLC